jgi:hypothetical protein
MNEDIFKLEGTNQFNNLTDCALISYANPPNKVSIPEPVLAIILALWKTVKPNETI